MWSDFSKNPKLFNEILFENQKNFLFKKKENKINIKNIDTNLTKVIDESLYLKYKMFFQSMRNEINVKLSKKLMTTYDESKFVNTDKGLVRIFPIKMYAELIDKDYVTVKSWYNDGKLTEKPFLIGKKDKKLYYLKEHIIHVYAITEFLNIKNFFDRIFFGLLNRVYYQVKNFFFLNYKVKNLEEK